MITIAKSSLVGWLVGFFTISIMHLSLYSIIESTWDLLWDHHGLLHTKYLLPLLRPLLYSA